MGEQGDDVIYGEDGDDLLIGGSNVAGALDGDDVIDGGAGNDAIAGDNAECCLRNDLLDLRMRALQGYGDLRDEHPGGHRRRRARDRGGAERPDRSSAVPHHAAGPQRRDRERAAGAVGR